MILKFYFSPFYWLFNFLNNLFTIINVKNFWFNRNFFDYMMLFCFRRIKSIIWTLGSARDLGSLGSAIY